MAQASRVPPVQHPKKAPTLKVPIEFTRLCAEWTAAKRDEQVVQVDAA